MQLVYPRLLRFEKPSELFMMLVKKNMVSPHAIVYKLLKLVLVLPIATAGVERIFSAINTIKNKLRSKMG
jgi:hypothetical protein